MRRLVLIAILSLAFSALASAVPALPGYYTYTQPDGTVIRLRNHGDEWYHWITDEHGNTVERDYIGYFRVVQVDHRAAFQRAKALRAKANEQRRAAHDPSLTVGERHIPVVIVSFKDLAFKISSPQTAFSNLLNQQNYSANGGHGSVRDYYTDNSSGIFTPVFDVFPPVALSGNYATYDAQPSSALLEACKELDATVDFSQYDYNNDGYVDMILFYYAGYNEAEGGPEDTIWPHQSGVYTNDTFDGLRLGTYFCTSELKGNSGTNMCGIGTTCHEFAHSLGLPDFYDTNYDNDGLLEATALSFFSPMCSGSYLSNSTRPAGFTALERDMLGWLSGEGIVEITSAGTYTLPAVQNNKAYRTNTGTDGEYFLYECRAGTGWDSALPTGMLIYHVDQSERLVNGIRAIDLWTNTNIINAYGPHPCCTLVPAAAPTQVAFGDLALARIVYPGSDKVTSYTPIDWDGLDTGIDLSGISYSGGQSQMNVAFRSVKGMQGYVSDTSGNPIQGATVQVGSASATTNAAGFYELSLGSVPDGSVTVRVSCGGFQAVEEEMVLGRFQYLRDFTLLRVGETPIETLKKYKAPYGGKSLGIGYTNMWVATIFRPEDLAPHVGKRLMTIDFVYAANSASAIYAIVDKGEYPYTEEVLRVPVTGLVKGWNHVDVSDQDFFIPSGEILHIGFYVEGADSQWLVAYEDAESGAGSGSLKIPDYPTYWFDYDDFNVFVSATIKEDEVPVEDTWRFPSIDNPGNGHYENGGVFALTLNPGEETPSSISWSYDGGPATSNYVALVSGTHLVEASLTYADGSTETVRLTIYVQ